VTSPSSLIVDNVRKLRYRGRLRRRLAFELSADFTLEGPGIVALLGPNGAGKTTLFDLIAGAEAPTSGRILCGGLSIHSVRHEHRARLVGHRQQRYCLKTPQYLAWSKPARRLYQLLRAQRPVDTLSPAIHLFDEPDMKDGFMALRALFFRELRAKGHLVLISIHPHDTRDLALIRDLCDGYLFLQQGRLRRFERFADFVADADVRHYLGDLAPPSEIADRPPQQQRQQPCGQR